MADITYTPLQWQDNNVASPYGGLSAARLTHIEDGIVAVTAQANTARSEGISLSRLPTGSNGQVLTMVSGVPAWATPAGGGGGSPTGSAGGDLAGTYPNPTLRTTLQDPVAATAGLRTLGTGAQQALNAATADLRHAAQWPGLVVPLAAGADVMSFGTAGDVGTASGARMVRVIIPKAGTLHDIAIWCTVQSGNVEAAIYDDHATTRNRLYTTGSIACPAAGQWSILGDPGLSVVQGQHLDFWLACDNITAQFRQKSASTGQGHLPANFLPSPNGAVPQIVGRIPSATMPMPATLAETNIGEGSTAPLIIARVA